MPSSAAARFHRLMGAVDGAMLIVTTAADEAAGCLVGFSTQCSIDPPRFLVCLSDKNRTYAVASRARHLAVHLVPAERHDLAELFGGTTGDVTDKLAGVAWRPGPAGVPLIDGCPDWFVGRIADTVRFGDHVGFVLDVVDAADHAPGGALLRLHQVTDIDAGHDP